MKPDISIFAEQEWFDKYILLEEMPGDRSYGHSFKAIHRDLDRKCYLKVFKNIDHLGKNAERIKTIAKQMALVSNNPHIESVYDFRCFNSIAFLELEWFDGSYFADFSNPSYFPKSMPNWHTFLNFMSDIVSGVSYAHSQKVYHGRIMWRYIFERSYSHEAILAGFGHAAYLAENKPERKLGLSEGGAGYLSPQQHSGILVKEPQPDPQENINNDLWGLGAVMYHILCRQTLHNTSNLEKAIQNLKNGIDLSLLYQKTEKYIAVIIERCFLNENHGGYQNTDQLFRELKAAADASLGIDIKERLWPQSAKFWFKNNSVSPKHNFHVNDLESKNHLNNYLSSIGYLLTLFENSWLNNPHFHQALKHTVGHVAACHGDNFEVARKIPSFSTIILLLAAAIKDIPNERTILSLRNAPWEELNDLLLLSDLLDDESDDENDKVQQDHERFRETLQTLLLKIRELFLSISSIENSSSHCAINDISFEDIEKGEIGISLSFDCSKLTTTKIFSGGKTTRTLREINDTLSLEPFSPVTFTFISENDGKNNFLKISKLKR